MADLQLAETLFTAMDEIIHKRIETLPYDKTILATITDVANAKKGEYTVDDGSSTFKAYSTNTEYSNGDRVYVSIPQGDYQQQKNITGKYALDNTNQTPLNYKDPIDSLIDIFGNLYENEQDQYTLIANGKKTETEVLWRWIADEDNPYVNFDLLGLSAGFYSSVGAIQAVYSGQYGLRLDIISKFRDTYTQYSFELDSKDFFGDPYNFEIFYKQSKTFNLKQYGIDRIDGMQVVFYQKNNFLNQDNERIAEIQEGYNLAVSNIDIRIGYDIKNYANSNNSVIIYTSDTNIIISSRTDEIKRKYPNRNIDQMNTEQLASFLDEVNNKTIKCRWIHKEEDGTFTCYGNDGIELPETAEIRWYRYKYEESMEGISWPNPPGDFWVEESAFHNSFTYNFSPKQVKHLEKIKVVICDPSQNYVEEQIINDIQCTNTREHMQASLNIYAHFDPTLLFRLAFENDYYKAYLRWQGGLDQEVLDPFLTTINKTYFENHYQDINSWYENKLSSSNDEDIFQICAIIKGQIKLLRQYLFNFKYFYFPTNNQSFINMYQNQILALESKYAQDTLEISQNENLTAEEKQSKLYILNDNYVEQRSELNSKIAQIREETSNNQQQFTIEEKINLLKTFYEEKYYLLEEFNLVTDFDRSKMNTDYKNLWLDFLTELNFTINNEDYIFEIGIPTNDLILFNYIFPYGSIIQTIDNIENELAKAPESRNYDTIKSTFESLNTIVTNDITSYEALYYELENSSVNSPEQYTQISIYKKFEEIYKGDLEKKENAETAIRTETNYYTSNEIEFLNENPNVWEEFDSIPTLTLEVDKANQNGVYKLYTTDNYLENEAEASINRIITARYTYAFSGNEDIDVAEEIIWRIPRENSMIMKPVPNIDFNIYDRVDSSKMNAIVFKNGTYYTYDSGTDTYSVATIYNATQTYYVSNGVIFIDNDTTSSYYDPDNYIIVRKMPKTDQTYYGKQELRNTEISFRIRPYYIPDFTNNTISCSVKRKNKVKTATTTLLFGTKDFNGTDYNFSIDLDSPRPYIVFNNTNAVKVIATLCDQKGVPQRITSGVTYSWHSCYSTSDNVANPTVGGLALNTSTGTITPKQRSDIKTYSHYILKATMNANVTINGSTTKSMKLTAYKPIIVVRDNFSYSWAARAATANQSALVAGSGNWQIKRSDCSPMISYSNAGTLKHYYQDPLALYFYDTFNKEFREIEGISWSTIHTAQCENNSVFKSQYYPQVTTEGQLLAPSLIIQYGNNQTVSVIATLNGTIIFIMPLFCYYELYSNKILNAWDGKLTLDKDNDIILAAMIGAGIKNNDNTFDGVLMGKVEGDSNEGSSNKYYNGIGLYGYNAGVKSFGFNINGYAFIGKSTGGGQIRFDGNEGVIESNLYQTGKIGLHINIKDSIIEMLGPKVSNASNAAYKAAIKIDANDTGTNDPNHIYFVIQGLKSDSTSAVNLMCVGKAAYYLQSANYSWDTTTNTGTGTYIDLKNGKFWTGSGNFTGNINGGSITIGNNFKVDNQGNMEATGALFTGSIRAGSTITGSTIVGGSIFVPTSSYNKNNLTESWNNCAFAVSSSGNMKCTNATITGGSITIRDGSTEYFKVTSTGRLTAKDAIINGGSITVSGSVRARTVGGYIPGTFMSVNPKNNSSDTWPGQAILTSGYLRFLGKLDTNYETCGYLYSFMAQTGPINLGLNVEGTDAVILSTSNNSLRAAWTSISNAGETSYKVSTLVENGMMVPVILCQNGLRSFGDIATYGNILVKGPDGRHGNRPDAIEYNAHINVYNTTEKITSAYHRYINNIASDASDYTYCYTQYIQMYGSSQKKSGNVGIWNYYLQHNTMYKYRRLNDNNYIWIGHILSVQEASGLGVAANYSDTKSSYDIKGAKVIQIEHGGNISFASTSDIRRKNVYGLLSNEEALILLEKINVVNYSYKGSNTIQSGFIAQQFRTLLKNYNIGFRGFLSIYDSKTKEDYYDLNNIPEDKVSYSLDYNRLVPVVWKGWQIHNNQIKELENTISNLQQQIKELKEKIK